MTAQQQFNFAVVIGKISLLLEQAEEARASNRVEVPFPPSLQGSSAAPHGLTEADVCGFIQHPNAPFWNGFNAVLLLVMVIEAFTWAFRLPRDWVARTTGSAWSAADMRLFTDKEVAVAWLQERERVPETTKRKRRAA
jgi:hypothetical protein